MTIPTSRERARIVRLYTDPPPHSTVVCVDELGPVAAKAYAGPSWSDAAHRPHFHPDYSRHGYVWAYGALAHRSGCVLVETAERRNTPSWLSFLDRLETFVPPGEAYVIVDGLVLHWSIDTMLWNWGHPRFHFVPLPKRAAWLNLIEGFWKILTQRSLHGRICRSAQTVAIALAAGVLDWNAHPTPFLWGRSPKPHRRLRRLSAYRI